MDERKFLTKIRKLQESGKKIGLTEMGDVNNMPTSKSIIKEETIDLDAINSDVQNLDPDEQREEENSFKDTVSKLVKFQKIKVHKENVEWSGHLIREKLDWVFSLDDAIGCYVDTTDFMQLRDETLETLKKLRGYYEVWSEEWSGRLTGTPTEDEGMEDMGEMEADVESGEAMDFGTDDGGF